jgi:plasmid stabilization system protein ParE
MAYRVAEDVDRELDDIWLCIAKQSGSIEIADKVVDSIAEDEDASILHVFHGSRDIESFYRH